MNTTMHWWRTIDGLLNGQLWMLQVFIVVIITLLLHFVANIVSNRLQRRLEKTHFLWDISFVSAIKRPLAALIWVIGLTFAANLVGEKSKNPLIFDAVMPLRNILIITIVVWFLVRLVTNYENALINSVKRKGLDKTAIHAVGQIVRAAIFITALLIGLSIFGIPISGLVAFGGVGGLAVGLAAKDLLANFFGGLMIVLDRPFSVGDWVRSPDRQIEGTVEHIGWRLTRIRTFDKRPLYVPNSLFSTISVENPSRMTNRRIYTTIGLRYDDATKIKDVLPDIENMLKNHPEIDTNQTLMVNLITFSASSLDFMIYTFTKTTDWVKFQAIQQDVFLKAIDIITAHGAECAFPTQTVHIPEGIQLNQAVKG